METGIIHNHNACLWKDLVKENLDQELKFIGLNISHIFVIGKFKIPGIVMQDLNKKMEAMQRAQQ